MIATLSCCQVKSAALKMLHLKPPCDYFGCWKITWKMQTGLQTLTNYLLNEFVVFSIRSWYQDPLSKGSTWSEAIWIAESWEQHWRRCNLLYKLRVTMVICNWYLGLHDWSFSNQFHSDCQGPPAVREQSMQEETEESDIQMEENKVNKYIRTWKTDIINFVSKEELCLGLSCV